MWREELGGDMSTYLGNVEGGARERREYLPRGSVEGGARERCEYLPGECGGRDLGEM